MDRSNNNNNNNNINQITKVPNSKSTDGTNGEHLGLSHRASANRSSRVLSSQSIVSNASQQPSAEIANNKASKRPKNTALKQQRLPAWQPVLTAKNVLPLFFSVGVVFCVLGGVLLHYSNIVNEKVINYTNCNSITNNGRCADTNVTCRCEVTFTLDNEFKAPVYFYYGLKNFYQNHRRYVKSRDDSQLLGRDVSSLNSECDPYRESNGSKVAPCGAIANSLFNDSFVVLYVPSSAPPIEVKVNRRGIAWNTDKNVKFDNPSSWEGTIKPKNWHKNVWELDPEDANNNGYKNEDLIVWMRTAALPSFRKLYRRVEHNSTINPNFTSSLPAGTYKVIIDYNYPVTVFKGEKTFVISTTTWIGGKNPFLGIAYLVVGSLCIVLGFCFLVVHFKFSRK
jgi:hypothetical protein